MGLIKINIEMLNKIVLGKVTLQYFLQCICLDQAYTLMRLKETNQ